MFITELSIKRPTVSWVMSLILIIFGLFVFLEIASERIAKWYTATCCANSSRL